MENTTERKKFLNMFPLFLNSKMEKKFFLSIIIVILLVLLVTFVINPILTGYGVYKQIKDSNQSVGDYLEDVQELKSSLLVSDANLSSCQAFNKEVLTRMEKAFEKFSECKSELGILEADFNSSKKMYKEKLEDLEVKLDERRDEIDKLKAEKEVEIKEWEDRYVILVQNLANNLCCKAKVDNPDIDYYKVEDNKIVCLEDGELSISCGF